MKNTTNYSKKIFTLLGSLRFSFLLLLLFCLLVAQRAIIAQKFVYLEDPPWFITALNALGLNSPDLLSIPMYGLLSLLVVNLALATISMTKRIKAKSIGLGGIRGLEAVQSMPISVDFFVPADGDALLTTFFEKKHLKITRESSASEARLYGIKRGLGRWGVLMFHLTFLVILVGALLSVLTRYAGIFDLAIGETFVESRDRYESVTAPPILFSGDKKFHLRLDAIDLSYWKPGALKQNASTVSIFTEHGVPLGERHLAINSPLRVDGVEIYQGSKTGFIAGLEAIDAVGTKAQGRVKFFLPARPDEPMISRVQFPGTNLILDLELFTDMVGTIKGLEGLGAQHKNKVSLLKVTVAGAHRIFNGVLFGGASLEVEGVTVRFVSLTPFTSFFAARDYGVPVIFAGFALLIFGLIITYFWVPEQYWAVVRQEENGERVVIGATTEKFKASFRERFEAEILALQAKGENFDR
ncbi:MAG: cytochrome c biogenesis protein ResB [Proteobacteria bacterium]|nr:cytochrome c biogenesis protein ResB [Pseudomonadota bacterium]